MKVKVIALFIAIRAVALLTLALAANFQGHDLKRIFFRWDAQWYRHIAESGYGRVVTAGDGRELADYAFFPLYPLLERLIHNVTSLSYIYSGILISAVASIVAAVGIYRVVEISISSKVATYTVILWAALPIAIVQSLAYSESLFTALAAWAIYFAIRRNWWIAPIFAIAAGLTRPTGIAVVLAVMGAAILELRKRRRNKVASFALLASPLGLLGYLYWVGTQLSGWNSYFDVTRGWGNSIDGGKAFAQWIKKFFDERQPILGLVLLLVVGALFALLWNLWRKSLPQPILIYTSLLVLLSLMTSGYFGSKPRYLLPAFPLLIPLAVALSKEVASRRRVAILLAVITSAAYGAIWLTGSGPL